MLKVNNKIIYLHKDTITNEELNNYISQLYKKDKEEIIKKYR